MTTKLWCTFHSRVEEALDESLKKLGLDYLDLYLVHWPLAMNPNGELALSLYEIFAQFLTTMAGNHPLFPKHEDGSRDIVHSHSHVTTWKSMEKLLTTGKVKAIGVSNYSVKYLEELLPQATVVPAVNQIENHPSLPQQEIVDFCKEKGIVITAYSPLGSTGSPLFTAAPIVEVAQKRGVTPATVLLSWHSECTNFHRHTIQRSVSNVNNFDLVARGSSVLAKSVTPSRIEDNRKLIHLDDSDIATIAKYSDDLAAKQAFQRFVFPPFGVDFGFPDKVGKL